MFSNYILSIVQCIFVYFYIQYKWGKNTYIHNFPFIFYYFVLFCFFALIPLRSDGF